ncbi:MAG: amidohydrolase, partial [Candidatus Thermoplasmatota archaeon]|nr:amidohydrolase [Candidatus Thermoplasmatota archaeon]
LDALPIQEINKLPYVSKNPGVSHTCGHDGHMTILIGLASWLQKEIKNLHGKVILLFQPAEETAEGAKLVLKDPNFSSIRPDYVFALHNLPGFKQDSIIVKKDVFSSASKGLIVKLIGKTSHAGHPENGNNPVFAMVEIIKKLTQIPKNIATDSNNLLVTIIHTKLGEMAFGTSPGEAVVMATFRSQHDKYMDLMSKEAVDLVKKTAEGHQLSYNVDWVEVFPATVNDNECVGVIVSSANLLKKDVIINEHPFSWSEDFSYFTQEIKGAMFGIGSGMGHAQLHNPDFDFPDSILDTGVDLFQEIIREISKKYNGE